MRALVTGAGKRLGRAMALCLAERGHDVAVHYASSAEAADEVVSLIDQKHIDRIGRLKNCIAYGPGVLELAHKPDEWVGIDDMVQSAQVMALSLATLLLTD